MNPTGVALGAIGPMTPMGVVAAPGPSGPVGIGIGVPMPIMSAGASPIVSQMGTFQPHKNLVSSDSLDDKDKFVAQLFVPRSSPTVSSLQTTGSPNSLMTWTNPLLQSSAGMGYPVMGMSVMGHTHQAPTHNLSDAVLYGLIGTAAANAQNRNISNTSVSIPSQNSVLVLSSINPPSTITEPLMMGTPDTKDMLTTPSQHESQLVLQCKDIMHCKSCTLFPPNPATPSPTTREKPPGCRTVFVGGLPENVTEEIIREIFDRCGEIATIRMSKKNFCHIRFELEKSIEAAIYLSGYRIRIGSNSDTPNIGRLHVDYAQARDDLFEFECRQRQLLRESRHRERIEKERLMPPSPPNIAPYSDHEAANVAEKIKSDDAFVKGIHTLVAWLAKGDCIKRNATCFYSMIQSTNSHVRRLLNEKSQYEDELQKAKELMRQRMTGLLLQFCQIEKVFSSACQKKAWDHFSKPQRKNIEMWRKQATEIKNILLEEALAERNDEEMELSDSETEGTEKRSEHANPAKKAKWDDHKTLNHLKEENDSLRCQLEASNNEVDMMKADLNSELQAKDEHLKSLQKKIDEAMQYEAAVSESIPTSTRANVGCNEEFNAGHCDSSSNNSANTAGNNQLGATLTLSITETDARLIGIISTFLHVHPFGASLDYIWSYTQQVLPTIRANEIEALMTKFPAVFHQEISGVGAMMERKWIFVGFQS